MACLADSGAEVSAFKMSCQTVVLLFCSLVMHDSINIFLIRSLVALVNSSRRNSSMTSVCRSALLPISKSKPSELENLFSSSIFWQKLWIVQTEASSSLSMARLKMSAETPAARHFSINSSNVASYRGSFSVASAKASAALIRMPRMRSLSSAVASLVNVTTRSLSIGICSSTINRSTI